MLAPLCLGVDPGATTGIALVEPLERPRLLLLRTIPARLGVEEWAERAYSAFAAINTLRGTRPVIGWYELTCPPPGNGWMGNNALSMRRGQLLGHASDAGLSLVQIEHVMVQTWTSILGVERKKRGDGSHRIAEAERLIEMDPRTFRGLEGAVDGAEAALMATARAWRLMRISAPKKPRAKSAKGRAA